MGNTVIIMSLVNVLVGTKDINILMAGLDGAGKTTILDKLNLGGMVTTISLMGFDIKKVEYENIRLEVFDLGGKVISPLLWRYFQNTQGLIFVVDSNDRERLTEANEELNRLLNEDALRNAALLVFANAEDYPTSVNVAEVTEILALHNIRNRSWYIQRASATRGDGLYEGLEWLTGQLSRS